MRPIAIIAMLSLVAAAPPGQRDPNWPCQQIKVPRLSLAAVWSGPVLDAQQEAWRHEPQVAELVQAMTQRRVPIEQAEAKVRAFAAQAGDQRQQKLLMALGGAFSVLDQERNSVIAGLDRFGARQKELAETLRQDNEKLRAMQADQAVKPADIKDMVQRVTWEAEVFQDRRQAISYACDVPAKIEQRLFVLARTVQDVLKE
jgi:hypothetical protein